MIVIVQECDTLPNVNVAWLKIFFRRFQLMTDGTNGEITYLNEAIADTFLLCIIDYTTYVPKITDLSLLIVY